MKITSKMHPDGSVSYNNFIVICEKDGFYGIYTTFNGSKYGNIVTSGETLNDACKKARMLQIGYNLGYNNAREDYW